MSTLEKIQQQENRDKYPRNLSGVNVAAHGLVTLLLVYPLAVSGQNVTILHSEIDLFPIMTR